MEASTRGAQGRASGLGEVEVTDYDGQNTARIDAHQQAFAFDCALLLFAFIARDGWTLAVLLVGGRLMPDYLAHVFEGLQAGASVGHMMRQSQQQDETNRRLQLQAEREWQVQQQQMAGRDIAERENLAKNATLVSPAGTVSQMMPAITGGAEGIPDIPSAPAVMKADASRTVKYGGQSYQLMSPEEQSARSLKSLEASETMKAGVESKKKLEELQNAASTEMKLPASALHEKFLGIPQGTMLPISKHAALDKAVASAQNAQSLEDSRNAKVQAPEDPWAHQIEVTDPKTGAPAVVVIHKSGKVDPPQPIAGGYRSTQDMISRRSAGVADRQAANEDRIDARSQAGRGEKDASEILKLDRQVQGLETGISGLNHVLKGKEGDRATFLNEKGKPETVTLTPDVIESLKLRAEAATQQREQLKGQRDMYARKLGWGTTQAGAQAAKPAAAAPVNSINTAAQAGKTMTGPDGKPYKWDAAKKDWVLASK